MDYFIYYTTSSVCMFLTVSFNWYSSVMNRMFNILCEEWEGVLCSKSNTCVQVTELNLFSYVALSCRLYCFLLVCYCLLSHHAHAFMRVYEMSHYLSSKKVICFGCTPWDWRKRKVEHSPSPNTPGLPQGSFRFNLSTHACFLPFTVFVIPHNLAPTAMSPC